MIDAIVVARHNDPTAEKVIDLVRRHNCGDFSDDKVNSIFDFDESSKTNHLNLLNLKLRLYRSIGLSIGLRLHHRKKKTNISFEYFL